MRIGLMCLFIITQGMAGLFEDEHDEKDEPVLEGNINTIFFLLNFYCNFFIAIFSSNFISSNVFTHILRRVCPRRS